MRRFVKRLIIFFIFRNESLLIISQNVGLIMNWDLPKNTVLRINLAWCNSIVELENILKTHTMKIKFLLIYQLVE